MRFCWKPLFRPVLLLTVISPLFSNAAAVRLGAMCGMALPARRLAVGFHATTTGPRGRLSFL